MPLAIPDGTPSHDRAQESPQESLAAALAFERTASEMIGALLAAGRTDQDRVIEASLGRLAQFFGAERATLWRRAGEQAEFVKAHRWLAAWVRPPEDVKAELGLPWIGKRLAAGSVVRFARHSDLPPEAAGDIPGLRALGIRAAVTVPLAAGGAVLGALSFATASDDHEWPDALIDRMELVGGVLASVLVRQAAERREQEAQAQAAHAARVGTMGLFAASLVHELTQPLAACLANAESAAELLAASTPDPDELRATVADIVADSRRAGELIQQLRRFLRRGEVERTALDARELLEEVLRLGGGELAANGVELALDYAEPLPALVGDRVQIQQVVLNLLLNAIDAVAVRDADGRRVALRAQPSQGGIVVEVSDSGPGMDEPTLARIFEPFFTTKPRGMGLGLSIGRTIVAAHGGTLTAQSAPGRGTTFRMELPSRQPDEAWPTQRSIAASSANGSVFVIDDDPSMRRALDRQLRGAGYRVETFASAQEYLDQAPTLAGVACIVSDVRMPGLSGLDLQASLAEAGRDLPIVFVSGHGDVSITAQAMRAGAVNFLAKPFSKGELLAAVAEALARGRVLEAARTERAELQSRHDGLTPREREVFALVAAGMPNKLIADRLGAAVATVKIHRGRVMEKMRAGSVADLVRTAERLGLRTASFPSSD